MICLSSLFLAAPLHILTIVGNSVGKDMAELPLSKMRELTEPGRYGDGRGLYLGVRGPNARSWILRVTVRGRRRGIGLGSAEDVKLEEARKKAAEMRRIARAGGDPLAERQKERRERIIFEQAARRVWAEQIEGHGRSATHVTQWINTLRDFAFPIIGNRSVDVFERKDIYRVLTSIWTEKAPTTRRVLQRLRNLLDWARTFGFREGIKPIEGVAKGLPRQRNKTKHLDALP